MKISVLLSTALALFATSTSALGVNCRGSKKCQSGGCQLDEIVRKIGEMDPWKEFKPGQKIACCSPGHKGKGKLCAYTQHTKENYSVLVLRGLAWRLHEHGCRRCGSFPINGVNVFDGELTVNYRD